VKKRFVLVAGEVICLMEFLLHTVIEWEDQMVYYAIYRCGRHAFFAQVQDNPKQIAAAIDFYFHWENRWVNEAIAERQLYWLGETVEKYINPVKNAERNQR
jgi:hypothetical protein